MLRHYHVAQLTLDAKIVVLPHCMSEIYHVAWRVFTMLRTERGTMLLHYHVVDVESTILRLPYHVANINFTIMQKSVLYHIAAIGHAIW